jgi:hypothetical protein
MLAMFALWVIATLGVVAVCWGGILLVLVGSNATAWTLLLSGLSIFVSANVLAHRSDE